MAYQTRISNVAAKAACDAIVDLIDGGASAGYVKIYPGTQPTDPDTATGETYLVQITLNDPAFGAAADATPGGRATADVDPALSGTAANAGTAAWFRVFDSNNVAIIDGDVGTTGSDMNINNTSISAGQTVSITSWTVTMAETEA